MALESLLNCEVEMKTQFGRRGLFRMAGSAAIGILICAPVYAQWTGKWEGDTLVVDTKGFNGKTWLDQLGKPTTESLHVVERFRRKDFGHMEIQITIDDPKAYTKPWTVTQEVHLLPNTQLLEFICNENNLDVKHLPGGPAR